MNAPIDYAKAERRQIIRQTHPECVEHQQMRQQLLFEQERTRRMEHAMRGAFRHCVKGENVAAMELLKWGLIGP